MSSCTFLQLQQAAISTHLLCVSSRVKIGNTLRVLGLYGLRLLVDRFCVFMFISAYSTSFSVFATLSSATH